MHAHKKHHFPLAVLAGFFCAAVPCRAITQGDVIFSASRDQTLGFLGLSSDNPDSNAKIVFVDENNKLFYIDYSETPLGIHQMQNVNHKVIAPCISSNGEWVVYATPGNDSLLTGDLTNDEDVKSCAWLCRLRDDATPVKVVSDYAHVPRFVKGDSTLDIVYSTIGVWDAWNKKLGKVKRKYIALDGTFSDVETAVYDSFACYGGLSHDGIFLATAIGNTGGGRMIDLQHPHEPPAFIHRLEVFTPDYSDTVEIAPQVCHPSISSDPFRPNVMMFLDFGSAAKLHHDIKFAQEPWYIHEIIFIRDYHDNLLAWIGQPGEIEKKTTTEAYAGRNSGEEGGCILTGNGNTWEFAEWSTDARFAVACVQTDRIWWRNGSWIGEVSTDVSRRKTEYAYLINVQNGSILRALALTDTLQGRTAAYKWPQLWVGKTPPPVSANPQRKKTFAITFNGNEIECGHNDYLSAVAVYALNGKLVKHHSFDNRNTSRIRLQKAGVVCAGMYIVEAHTRKKGFMRFRALIPDR